MLFFFCKQKTAYEMRISDWSSDVCSSDLDLFPPLPPLADQCAVRHEHVVEENLVEIVMPRHVDDRADRDAGRIEVDQQLAEPRITLARSEEHTSELQSLMRISYAVFCLKKKKTTTTPNNIHTTHTH